MRCGAGFKRLTCGAGCAAGKQLASASSKASSPRHWQQQRRFCMLLLLMSMASQKHLSRRIAMKED
jgi:hypothetical protein